MNIEELAFENRKTLANLNRIDLLDIIELLQEDRNQRINQFTKIHNEGVEIQKENQELKSQLSGTTFCYDEEEYIKLKKQLEEINKMIEKCGFVNIEQVMLNYCGLLTQQKEFIKYLVNMMSNEKDKFSVIRVRDVLQKYKEIIEK